MNDFTSFDSDEIQCNGSHLNRWSRWRCLNVLRRTTKTGNIQFLWKTFIVYQEVIRCNVPLAQTFSQNAKKNITFSFIFFDCHTKYAYVQLYEKLCVKKKIPTKSRIGVGHARAIFRFSLTLFTFELIINDWNMYSLRLDTSHSSFSKLDYLRLQQRQWPHLLYFRSTLAHPTSWLKWNDSVLIV